MQALLTVVFRNSVSLARSPFPDARSSYLGGAWLMKTSQSLVLDASSAMFTMTSAAFLTKLAPSAVLAYVTFTEPH